jgi:tRNA threonylcarbamoyladenosine biosynthesis protein TsaB
MTRVLAIDTTGEFGGVALLVDGRPVEDSVMHSPDGFAHVLLGHLDQLLRRQAIALSDIDVFASASGPGSFTGVRVGLAAAKGLAEACGKPVIAVSNLRALAWHGRGPLRAAFVDARRGEIYGGVYSATLELVAEERVMKFPDWLDWLAGHGELEYITTEPSLFPAVAARAAPRALAGAVAAIAYADFNRGRAVDPAEVDANYVRRSDAELLWKDR